MYRFTMEVSDHNLGRNDEWKGRGCEDSENSL